MAESPVTAVPPVFVNVIQTLNHCPVETFAGEAIAAVKAPGVVIAPAAATTPVATEPPELASVPDTVVESVTAPATVPA